MVSCQSSLSSYHLCARYSPRVVHLHLAILPIALMTMIASAALAVVGLEDTSRDGVILSLNLILTSIVAGTIVLLATSSALHLTLGVAIRDPEFEGRVRRGEAGARALVIIGGKLAGFEVQARSQGVESVGRGCGRAPTTLESAVVSAEDVE